MRYVLFSIKSLIILLAIGMLFLGIKNTSYTGNTLAFSQEWDMNKDHTIDQTDADTLATIIRENKNEGDFNEDGATDIVDFSILLLHMQN